MPRNPSTSPCRAGTGPFSPGLSTVWVLALLLSVSACGGGADHDDEPSLPVDLRPVKGPVHHEVDLEIRFSGSFGEMVDARLQLSTDGGLNYRDVAVSPPGPYLMKGATTEHAVVWDSERDLGHGRFDILLRVHTRPHEIASTPQSVTVANYALTTSEELADWAFRGADPEELVLADAWSFDNWANGHLEGAVSIPVDRILEEGAAALPYSLDRRLVFYCGGGT